MKKIKLSFYFVFISFFTFLTIFFSIIQKSYFSFITPQKMIENDTLLNDFNPNLDLTVISTIESKNTNIEEPFDFSIIKSKQTLKTITSVPTATVPTAAVPTATPQITENQISQETVAEMGTAPTLTSTTPTPQTTKNPTSKEAVTSVATPVRSGSVSTSTQ